ncbi:calcium-translocating P-type ATPase [Polyplosphaeria fusca]|uniref:Calcium-transporting ATPase n=1 Tax=Polyplosphaeria fusca TaxID=682080 RepID=A0A9P4R4Y0_9PLEO|nr:calcium-translocating P-type ATPase [Polyplosphaeria fusca]
MADPGTEDAAANGKGEKKVVLPEEKPPQSFSEQLKDALTPDPGTEPLFEVENNQFAFSPGQLGKLINPKSLAAFYSLGGLRGLEKGLRTSCSSGLSVDETGLNGVVSFEEATTKTLDSSEKGHIISTSTSADAPKTSSNAGSFTDRKRVFSDNRLPEKKTKSLLQLAWITYNDKVLILLTIAAVVSLALGLYQTFGQPHEPGEAQVEWVEGVAIMVAIIIVVLVGTVNDWQKERQFVKLNKKNDDRTVKVIRSGVSQQISVYDVLVGDVMHLEPGDVIPVDGVFIQGHNVKCDESSATGESDLLRKSASDEVFQTLEKEDFRNLNKMDPFLISGSKIAEGTGTFLVTATGVNSAHGRTTMALREDSDATPLQQKLNVLADYIAKLGGAAALLLFIVLFIKFLAQLPGSPLNASQKGQAFLQIFIMSVTVVVVAVPEGLPLAVTLALAYATTRMLKDNNLVRVLKACETMGNATTVCSDKTGTLTENKMTVVAGTIGLSTSFGAAPNESKVTEKPEEGQPSETLSRTSISESLSNLSAEVKALLVQAITVNSTAFEGVQEGRATFIGSKTETALLEFARDRLGAGPLQTERANAIIAEVVPFDSARKYMATVVKLSDGKYRAYVKGASEILLDKCSQILGDPSSSTLFGGALSEADMEELTNIITTYASETLRTIALSYRDFECWPPSGHSGDSAAAMDDFVTAHENMTLIGIVGIKDPLRAGVREAVRDCRDAGVVVRMVTGDNLLTAKAIAAECGIYTPETDGIVMEGPNFRRLPEDDMKNTVLKLQVLARSSPEDKRLLVQTLKGLGETVAVTGDGTNDAPALKTADIGFSMGIAGTEVAKEASEIVLMDDNFSSIVKGIMWGRAVNDAVKKFLQFQLTVNITAVALTFITAVASNEEESVLTAVQLLWVNLIMDTFAALALATDPPNRNILKRLPDRKSAALISVRMWKMIIGQAIFQLTVTLVLHFAGEDILGYDSPHEKEELRTLVFNTFVWMQIFNQLNNRRLDNGLNIFEAIHKNTFFIFINFLMVGGQVLIIFVGGRAFNVTRLNGIQWAISIVLGLLSLPWAVVIRIIPDMWAARIVPYALRKRWLPEAVTDEEKMKRERTGSNLEFMRKIRGGRSNSMRLRSSTLNGSSGFERMPGAGSDAVR